MRSLEEIDAEIRQLQEEKAGLSDGIPTRMIPEYRASRFDYILKGDRSGLDAYQQALQNAMLQKAQRVENDRLQEAQRKFTEAENEKNRQVQREQAGITKATEKAKMLRDYADAQALVSDIDNNPSNYGSKVAIEKAKAKNNLEMVKKNMLDSGMFTEADLADPKTDNDDDNSNNPAGSGSEEPQTPAKPVADWNKDKPEIERLIKEGKYDEAQAIIDRQNKDDAGIQADMQKMIGDINAGRKKDAEKAEAKRFKAAKVKHVKANLPSTIEIRKALDMGKAGGGKSEGVIKGKTFLYGNNNKEIGDIVVKKDGTSKAKVYVDGEYVGEQSLDL